MYNYIIMQFKYDVADLEDMRKIFSIWSSLNHTSLPLQAMKPTVSVVIRKYNCCFLPN